MSAPREQHDRGARNLDRPILFSAPMVRALLDGRKTQTRRVVKGVDPDEFGHIWGTAERDGRWEVVFSDYPGDQHIARIGVLCPYGVPGDRLWVREAWAKVPASAYRMSDSVRQTVNPSDADEAAVYAEGWERSRPGRWRPSIHMPRWASRLTLTITDVRVERLQDISEADAIAEGLLPAPGGWWSGFEGSAASDPVSAYALLWNQINGPGSWDANPWIWALTFDVAKANVEQVAT